MDRVADRSVCFVYLLLIISAAVPFPALSYADDIRLFDKKKECRGAYLYHFLNRSCYYGDDIGVRIMLSEGADPNGKDYGNYPDCVGPFEFSTPLYLAVSGNHIEVVRILLKAGADPNILEGEGVTSLVEAVEKEHIEIIKLLLKSGARTDMKGLLYKPSDIARKKGNTEILKLLKGN